MQGRWDAQRRVLVLYDESGTAIGEVPVSGATGDLFDRAAGGDVDARNQVQQFVQGVQAHLGEGQGQGGSTQGVLAEASPFKAAARQIGIANAYRGGLQKLADSEAAMVAEMQQAGVDPRRFFSTSPSAGGVAGLPQSNLAAVAVAHGPEYADAFGALDEALADVDLTTRAGQLSEAGRQWQAAKVGIDRMEKLRNARTEIEDTERAYADAEAQASKDIGQDRNLVPITNADGSVSWSHSGNAGTRRALDRARAEYQRMQDTWYPEQGRAIRQQQAREGTGPALQGYQYQALMGTDASDPEYQRRYPLDEPPRPRDRNTLTGLRTEYALGGRTGAADVIPAPRRSGNGGNITITIAVPAGGGGGGVNAVTSPPRPRSRLATGGRVARYEDGGGGGPVTGLGAPGVTTPQQQQEIAIQRMGEKAAAQRQAMAQQRAQAEARYAQTMQAAQFERQQALAQVQQRLASQSISAARQGAANPWAAVSGMGKVG